MTRNELEVAIQELEGKLPELRRLLAEGELHFALSNDAQAWAKSLLLSLQLSDELAGRLRRELLAGVLPSLPDDAAPMSPAVVILPSQDRFVRAGGSEMELELERVLFGDMINVTPNEANAATTEPETTASSTANEARAESTASFVDDQSEEVLDQVEQVMASEEEMVPPISRAWERLLVIPEDFAEIRRQYQPLLLMTAKERLTESEAETVVRQALEQAERVFVAAEKEVSVLQLLAESLIDQIERLLPSERSGFRWPWQAKSEGALPTVAWAYKYLSTLRVEQFLSELDGKIAVREADLREETDPEKILTVSLELTRLQEARDTLVQSFYNPQLNLGDDDETASGTMGVPVVPPPPMRGPGEKRTFEEALAAPRNP